jgi:fructose-bisphosphate aldolase, class II
MVSFKKYFSSRRHFVKNPSEFDPRKYLGDAIKAMKDICKARYEEFGTAGWADKIKVDSFAKMTARYQSGELMPKINGAKVGEAV